MFIHRTLGTQHAADAIVTVCARHRESWPAKGRRGGHRRRHPRPRDSVPLALKQDARRLVAASIRALQPAHEA